MKGHQKSRILEINQLVYLEVSFDYNRNKQKKKSLNQQLILVTM